MRSQVYFVSMLIIPFLYLKTAHKPQLLFYKNCLYCSNCNNFISIKNFCKILLFVVYKNHLCMCVCVYVCILCSFNNHNCCIFVLLYLCIAVSLYCCIFVVLYSRSRLRAKLYAPTLRYR